MNKVSVFGGSFNPLHMGHINSMKSVKERLGLDTIRVVPAYESPNRKKLEGPNPDQRLEMVARGLKDYRDIFEVDDLEILRGGTSYTIETIKEYTTAFPDDEFYLIIGMDQFEKFDQWNQFKEILSLANLVVTSRPGSQFPESLEDFPEGIQGLVEEYADQMTILTEGKSIQFIQLEDMDVSATEIRKKLRDGESVEDYMPLPVRNFIRDHELYESLGRVIGDFEKFTLRCGEILQSKNGINVLGFDVRKLNQSSEYTLIASGTSTRHASALADHVIRAVKKSYGVYPQNIEGQKEGRWVVVDYGSLIIHLFYDFVRLEYQLEKLWDKGIPMELPTLEHLKK